jgi:hypothetical protein
MVDGEVHGSLARGTYIVIDTEPGKHVVSYWADRILRIDVEMGQTYFIKLSQEFLHVNFEHVEMEEGKAGVEKCKRIMCIR